MNPDAAHARCAAVTRGGLPLRFGRQHGGEVFWFDTKLFHAMAEIRNHAISLPFVHKIFVLLKRVAFCQLQIARGSRDSIEPM